MPIVADPLLIAGLALLKARYEFLCTPAGQRVVDAALDTFGHLKADADKLLAHIPAIGATDAAKVTK